MFRVSTRAEEKRRIDAIKGINSRAIIVSSKLPPMFKEAIFILSEKYEAGGGDIMEQADKALSEYSKGIGLAPKKTSPVWPVIAIASTAAFILKLTGLI